MEDVTNSSTPDQAEARLDLEMRLHQYQILQEAVGATSRTAFTIAAIFMTG